MADLSLRSFERNRYYNGKLMTVRDFQTEQTYFNEKRHLLNRLLYGAGVVCGLHVEPLASAENRGIRIRPGAALDGCGQEIVVARESVQSDIREIPGYPADSQAQKTLYLMLHYDECARQPVQTDAAAASAGGCENNRLLETFRLSWAATPPTSADDWSGITHKATVLYANDKVRIERVLPRWTRASDTFEAVIRLTALVMLSPSDAFDIELKETLSSGLIRLQSDSLTFVFAGLDAGAAIERRYTVRSEAGAEIGRFGGNIAYQMNSFKENKATPESIVSILDEQSLTERLVEAYFEEQIGQEGGCSGAEGILIASVTLNNQGFISAVDDRHRPYIYSHRLIARLLEGTGSERLPKHGGSHEAGGIDQLDVTGLRGVLADRQKIGVAQGGEHAEDTDTRSIHFVGDGVTVSEDGGVAYVNIPGGNGGPHAGNHQAGGSDPINVANLQGVLAEPQKMRINYGDYWMTAGSFSLNGQEVSMHEDNGHVSFFVGNPYQCISGYASFDNVPAGGHFVSDKIYLYTNTKDLCFTIGLLDDNGTVRMYYGDSFGTNVPAINYNYYPSEGYMVITLFDRRTGTTTLPRVNYKVRWWAVPLTSDRGRVGSTQIIIG
ncbi:hypothetical protein H8B09_26975 [Paenibacillus sp. PR3]|uniref:Uncharacterized protein n=1 Tax=Paenibacillus terricola TaxID=2763503 RepID=A0ABR8N5G2_9BACL|nr:hypothetical protein [Paenibacillus terricola]MBD3922425.1 hypothetical protein [Paenibacillus terricola]